MSGSFWTLTIAASMSSAWRRRMTYAASGRSWCIMASARSAAVFPLIMSSLAIPKLSRPDVPPHAIVMATTAPRAAVLTVFVLLLIKYVTTITVSSDRGARPACYGTADDVDRPETVVDAASRVPHSARGLPQRECLAEESLGTDHLRRWQPVMRLWTRCWQSMAHGRKKLIAFAIISAPAVRPR